MKEQTERLRDFPLAQLSLYEAEKEIVLVGACKTCHAVSSASVGSRKGGRDTWF